MQHIFLTSVVAAHLQIAEVSRRILFSSQLDGWQLGKSRVFLRAGQLAQLEVRLPHLCVWQPASSCCVRLGHTTHTLTSTPEIYHLSLQGARGRRLTTAALKIQAAWRGMEARQQLRRARLAATAIQVGLQHAAPAASAACWLLGNSCMAVQHVLLALTQVLASLPLQAAWRGHRARQLAQQLRQDRAATRLQAAWRMYRQRSAYLLQRR
jgi:myosin-5